MQDRAVLYADVSKVLVQTANILSDSFQPDHARALADSWLAQARTLANTGSAANIGRSYVGNPETVRLPNKTSNKRIKTFVETGGSLRSAVLSQRR